MSASTVTRRERGNLLPISRLPSDRNLIEAHVSGVVWGICVVCFSPSAFGNFLIPSRRILHVFYV
jgi:hypothetical protein